MATWVHDNGRSGIGHFPGGSADVLRFDLRDAIGPFGGEGSHMILELSESESVFVDVLLVIQVFIDQDVHPRQQECYIGCRLYGQPVFRFARSGRKAGVNGYDGRPLVDGIGHFLDLGVVHVLTDVRADENETARVPDVCRLRRSNPATEGRGKPGFPGSSALCIGGFGNGVRPHGLEKVFQVFSGGSVLEQGYRFRAMSLTDFCEFFGD